MQQYRGDEQNASGKRNQVVVLPVPADELPDFMEEEQAENRAKDGSAAAKDAGAAEDDSRDHFKLDARADVSLGRVSTRGEEHCRQPRGASGEGIKNELDRCDGDARQVAGFLIVADGEDPSAGHGFPEKESGDRGEGEKKDGAGWDAQSRR